MERSPPHAPSKAAGLPADRRAAEREARLAAALRANLRRRKAQSRARQDEGEAGAEAVDRPPPSTDADDRGAT